MFLSHDDRDRKFGEMANHLKPWLENCPLVTVFVGCYNQSRFVEECLYSVKHQTYPNIQVIILTIVRKITQLQLSIAGSKSIALTGSSFLTQKHGNLSEPE